MRNLKKVLSLVLCLGVMLSIMVVGANAAFTDAKDIDAKHQEAVDACVALNIINGRGDGSFDPKATVTREEMCKMICVLLNGGQDPVLGNSGSTFADVPEYWAAPYIESCYSRGIVAGTGNNMFSPKAQLTGTQAARMLLVALGFDQNKQGYVGASWAINVNVDASNRGFYADLEDIDPSAALSREHAAEMIWNALNAYEVEYKSNLVAENGQLTSQNVLQDRVVGGTDDKITLLEDTYDSTTRNTTLTGVHYDSDDNTYNTQTADLPDLDANTDYSELMGQQIKVMTALNHKLNKTVLLGLYPSSDNKVVKAIFDDVKSGDMANFKTAAAGTNGLKAEINSKDYDLAAGLDIVATNGNAYNGALEPWFSFTLVDNNKDDKYDVLVVNPFIVAEVTDVTAKKIYFENTLDSSDTYNPDKEDVQAYNGIAKDDYAYYTLDTYTVSGDNEAVKADSIKAKVSGTKTDSIKLNDAWYTQADASVDMPSSGDDLEYAIVCNGFFFATDGTTGSADRLAVVLKVSDDTADFDGDYYNAKVLINDGSKQTVKAYVKHGSDKDKPVVGTMYTYTTNSTGYVLKEIATGKDIGYDDYTVSSTKYNSGTNKVYNNVKAMDARLATDAQVFVLFDKSGNTYDGKVATGTAADKWKTADYNVDTLYTDDDNKAVVMLVNLNTESKAPNASDDFVYGVALTEPYTDKNADDEDVWVIDRLLTASGVVSNVVVDSDEWYDGLTKNLLITYDMDGNDYVSFDPKGDKTYTSIVGAVTDIDGKYYTVLTIDGKTYDFKTDSDSSVLYVDTDAEDAASGSIKKATKKDASNYYANIMVIFDPTDMEDDQSFIIKGAAFDVTNQLQNADDEDILIPVI